MNRRRLLHAGLAALPVLSACTAPLPLMLGPRSSPAAAALFRDACEAHGLAAFRALRDINVSYAGEWRALVGRLQPALVDAGFRGSSQERLLPPQRLIAQAHSGPSGRKQVLRRAGRAADPSPGEVQVWFNGEEARDAERRDAAALVADGYALFLCGPLWLAGRDLVMDRGGTDVVDERLCDLLYVELKPGLGFSVLDRLALFIDREDRLMRRVRFSLDGLAATRGAIAEVDTFDFIQRHGVLWPTRFYERLQRPIPRLPVHDWRLTGLDVNRGYGAEALSGPAFSGAALAPAAALPAA
ncbi:hypothetical protein [Methylibium sp.]|uniref:hypothetical protein n=1 Tax=Methylibium sp. TaxID=2067992 RepID=UPI003D128DD3